MPNRSLLLLDFLFSFLLGRLQRMRMRLEAITVRIPLHIEMCKLLACRRLHEREVGIV